MFSNNGKISEKQIRRMLVLSVFSSIIFVLPFLSANLFGESIVPGLCIFFALSGLYVLYICGMGAWYEKCRTATGREGYISMFSESGLVGGVLTLVQFVRLIIRLAFYILLTIAILEEAQVPFMVKTGEEIWSNIFVVLPLLLVGVYGANTQVEKQGRVHEMLFWFLFLPFVVMLLFGICEVDYQIFEPKISMPLSKMLFISYLLLTFVLPMENYLYFRPDLQKLKGKNATGVAVIAIIGLGILMALFMIGIYGLNGAANEPMTTIAIMRYIRLPFGVLERFDILMIWFLIIGCFVLICQTLYCAGYLFRRVCKRGKLVWVLLFALLLSLCIVLFLRTYENGLLSFVCYGVMMDIPLSIILPLLGIFVNDCYGKSEMSETESEVVEE